MNENTQNIMLPSATPYVLLAILVIALGLAISRPSRPVKADVRLKFVGIFLIGIACQCAHFIEEFVTGFYSYFPPIFGLIPLSPELFVGFNVFWIGIWALSAYGVMHDSGIAYFPVWFFGLGMCLNLVAHPLLAVWAGGYFPGLITSPAVGIMGVVVTRRLFQLTDSRSNNEIHSADDSP